ncbi:hypothetical protein [Nostocoides sp. HKS02]|uniref:hypothetical protein n=1 Tax=Nostocoides sp. HKS02 TaxID=1813880 RepID=UPI0012B46B4D|nr:hypothetical protein [Tetrasphaera sp. HKS02]QGN58549.1 hypothetical protein GKE56_12375 [Tetrasphaera sp. HKS02]
MPERNHHDEHAQLHRHLAQHHPTHGPRRGLRRDRHRVASDGRQRARERLATGYRAPRRRHGLLRSDPLTLTFPENKEFFRTTPGDGLVVDHVDQFTGSLSVRFTTASGRSVTLSAGGPGRVITYTSGDVETHSEGWYNYAFPDPRQAAELGVPQIFSTTGLIDYITHPDQSITPVTVPHHVIDICAELGLG